MKVNHPNFTKMVAFKVNEVNKDAIEVEVDWFILYEYGVCTL